MTPEQSKKLDEAVQMSREIHDFWLKSDREGKPTRADQVDELLALLRAGTLSATVFMRLCAFIILVGTVVAAVRGLMR